MFLRSPQAIRKTWPNQPRSMSTSDLSSNDLISTTVEMTKSVQHSPKKFINVNKIDVQAKKSEIKTSLIGNKISAINCDDKQSKSASLNKDNETISDVGQNFVQTGIDRYITVLPKRKRSPRSAASTSVNKWTRLASVELTHDNRFSSLVETNEANSESTPEEIVSKKTEKPPPIYLRQESNRDLTKAIELLTEGQFFISGIKRGNIKETKIQALNIDAYKALINHFDQVGKNYYTYQLKSQKGLVVMIKGIESFIESNEILDALAAKGFMAKSITNIINRKKEPQPMFRVELEPDTKKVKGKHDIFDLKYLLHRRISIEEPRRRTGPVQCVKCQEYGHTRAYCTLSDVCVICGELHNSKQCNKTKTDATVKKCSNCDGNHTANYRGCPVYLELKRKISPRQRAEQRMLKADSQPEVTFSNIQYENRKATTNTSVHNGVSYASVLKGTVPTVQANDDINISTALNKLTSMMQSFMAMMERTMGLMMQNMNTLMQIVVKNQK